MDCPSKHAEMSDSLVTMSDPASSEVLMRSGGVEIGEGKDAICGVVRLPMLRPC